jgi:hypothetical protein
MHESASHKNEGETPMFRKSILAIAAVAVISAAALVPTTASAGGGGGKGGGGWGGKGGGFHHWGHGGLFLSTAVASSCWQWVETRRGLARVYVCD